MNPLSYCPCLHFYLLQVMMMVVEVEVVEVMMRVVVVVVFEVMMGVVVVVFEVMM
jgi:hypothetical protein